MRDAEWEMMCQEKESRNMTHLQLFDLIIEALEKEPITKDEKDKQKTRSFMASWESIDKLQELCKTYGMTRNALLVLGLKRISKP